MEKHTSLQRIKSIEYVPKLFNIQVRIRRNNVKLSDVSRKVLFIAAVITHICNRRHMYNLIMSINLTNESL